jgi:hypothetical protein
VGWQTSRRVTSSPPKEASLSGRMKFGIAGVIVGFILLFVLPWWVGLVLIAAAIGIPLGGYLMLDPSQRRRIKRIRRRQIGS